MMIATSLIGLLVMYVDTVSHQNGITGQTVAGCTCHSLNPSGSTTVTITAASGNFNVDPGSTTTYTATVANPTQAGAGIDISLTDANGLNVGTLAPGAGSGLQLLNGELTHLSPKSMTGGQAQFQFTWTAPNAAGQYTLQAAGNAVNLSGTNSGDLWNFLTPITVTVKGLDLTAPNGGQTWCAGATQNITWNNFGVTNVKIEASTDGGNTFPILLVASTPAATGSWPWAIPAGQARGNQYRIRISDAASPNVNDVSAANFTITGGPSIDTQPTAVTVCTGQVANFTVAATGSGLTYQWRKNGANINGGNTQTLAIGAPTIADAGTYDVVVSNSCASVTSNAVTLTVNTPPTLITQPTAMIGCEGQPATFSVAASGTNITYQWFKDNNPIPGATSNTYTIASVQQSDAAAYKVTISGACDPAVTSLAAALTVNKAPAVTTTPKAQTLCEGQPLSLSVTATGQNLKYQWRKDGTAINGATSATYSVASAAPANAGNYDVVVSGSCSPAVTTAAVAVTINPRPHVTTNPINQTVVVGSGVQFSITATGPNIQYRWRRNGIDISGATGATYSIASAKEADAGLYDCYVTNSCGSDTSAAARLTVNPPGSGPAIVFAPSPVDFGPTRVGIPKEQNFPNLIRNSGDDTLKVSAMTISGANQSEFTIVSGAAPFDVPPGGLHAVLLRFTPGTTGQRTASLDFTSNAKENPSLTLIGTGAQPGISTSTPEVNFGSLQPSTNHDTVVSICNSSTLDVILASYEVRGDDAFHLVSPPTFPLALKPDSCVSFTIRFAPTQLGVANGQLVVHSDGGADSIVVALSGTSSTSSVPAEPSIATVRIAPNPTAGATTIGIELVKSVDLDVVVSDMRGDIVRRFATRRASAGLHSIMWDGAGDDGRRLPSGVYQVVVHAGGMTTTIPVSLVR
jgi:hypothetical protein